MTLSADSRKPEVPVHMNIRELEEYQALRATIRERGTARVWIFMVGLGFWAAMVIAVAALASLPVATLLPLLMLAGVFQAVYAIHTAVERIGRYLQVFYEMDEGTGPGERHWERMAMAFGQANPGRGTDPLFSTLFILATLVNMVPAMLADAVLQEWVIIGVAHAIFIGNILVAKRHAGRQRALDLVAFQKLKESEAPTHSA